MTQGMVRPTNEPKPSTLQMRVSEEFLKKVDAWRRKQEDLPGRSEAIRRLVEMALKAK
jgi:metal-responsive CopG/Arc/MetJ family transcriptional regulator